MKITRGFDTDPDAIINFFAEVFEQSEGRDEGAVIRSLTQDLLNTTPSDDLQIFSVKDFDNTIGIVAFSRLYFPQDPRVVWMLSPMAVATHRQRQGIGQTLITHALATLNDEGADAAVTYGSPDYYGQVGFVPVTVDQVAAPMPLSMPFGWLGQCFKTQGPLTLTGPCRCVPAFNRPDVW